MKPVQVYLVLHTATALEWLFKGCAGSFVADDYDIICDEGAFKKQPQPINN